MKEWTEKEINDIIGLKGTDGEQIDVFDLTGVVYVGNCLDEPKWVPGKGVERVRMWNIDKRFTWFRTTNLGFSLDDFDDYCEDEDDVNQRFNDLLKERLL